jgi:hypothetical protein
MTDREPTIPADLLRPQNFRSQIDLLVGDLSPNANVEPAQRGDFPPMPLTLAPRPPSRASATDTPPAGSVRAWLGQITSATANLAPFTPLALPGSLARNLTEAEAASRAAGCPDLFAIQAPEQTARERVITDIAWASCSKRVLVLSPDPNFADRVVERLIKVNVQTVRALAEDENPVRSSPVVTKATSSTLASLQFERLKNEVAANVANATVRLNAIETALTTHARIDPLTDRCDELVREIATIKSLCEGVDSQVQLEASGRETTSFTNFVKQRKIEGQEIVDGLIQKRSATLDIHKEKVAQVGDLRKRAGKPADGTAKKSGFIARLLGRAKPNPQPGELDKQLQECERELNDIEATISRLQQDLQIASARLSEETEKLIQAEIAIRRAELDSKLSLLTNELSARKTELDAATQRLGPDPLTRQALTIAREDAEKELVSALQRVPGNQFSTDELMKLLLVELPIVVGTPGCLEVDPVFKHEPHDPHFPPPFELLVLDRAEELTEPDFLHLAKLAKRYVIVGNVAPADDSHGHDRGSRHLPGIGRNGKAAEMRFASRLARQLDREKWTIETDRLVCRLQQIRAYERRNIVCEPLLDRPEIELRFITNSDGEPVLVEVAFPPALSIAAAKSFLYQQLGEVLLRPSGEVHWHSSEVTITACWATVEQASKTAEHNWIELEPGVREKVVGSGLSAFTAAVTFDATRGWTLAKAEQWLHDHHNFESPSRFAAVTRR